MEVAIVLVAIIAFVAFREWLRFQQRALVHRERLAAVEKGVELPPLVHEVHRREINVKRMLLLLGLVWISLGVGVFVTLTALTSYPSNAGLQIPLGMQWVGLAPAAIGLSHLIVYAVGKKKEGAAENLPKR